MTEVIGVRFRLSGKVYYFDPNGVTAEVGDKLIVETARGVEMGETVQPNHPADTEGLETPLRQVLRKATAEDLAVVEANRAKEREAMGVFRKKIAEHGLEMDAVDVCYAFDGNKILFYFTSEGRVDFRDLVKDLAGIFRTRIELRQIGVRDEAKMLGGLGICGRPFCCATFLDEFAPISIKMAKEQGGSLNPVKISGTCGRLMCCLRYEQAAYEDMIRRSPSPDSLVETPAGRGTVTEVMLLKGLVKVRLDSGDDQNEQVFACDDVQVLRRGRAKPEKKKAESAEDETAAG